MNSPRKPRKDKAEPAPLVRAGLSEEFVTEVFRQARPLLLRWFARNARALPWRPPDPLAVPAASDPLLSGSQTRPSHAQPERSPYAVWISEIMLQQTQVATVIAYFRNWMAAFPDVSALAGASEEKVLRAWAGLGYYSRARNIHKAAQALVERGAWPVNAEEWKALPGVGDYTAGAVSSLAFARRAPIVDGNVVRLFSRLLGLNFLPGEGRAERDAYWDLATLWAGHAQPGTVNEAMMELGALVCVPSTPRCEACPLSEHCVAFRTGRVGEFPPVKKRAAIEGVSGVAVRVRLGRKVLAERRGPGAFLAGHEMFPLFLGPGAGDWRALFETRFPSLRIARAAAAGRVRHSIMSKRYDLEIWDCTAVSSRPAPADLAAPEMLWIPEPEVEERLTNALARKIWTAAESAHSTS